MINMSKNYDKKNMALVWARINLYYALEHKKLVEHYKAEKKVKEVYLNN